MLISSGAIENVVDFSIFRLQDKSLKVLIPCITVMMSLLGGLAGNDAMITFVACGMLLARRTRLDRVAGMAIFYLPYITGQAIGPTVLMILMCQEMCGIPAVSGLPVRIMIWIIFTVVCAVYNTRYALRVSDDPSKSIDGEILEPDSGSREDSGPVSLKTSSVVSVVMILLPFVIYAYGSSKYSWGFEYLIGIGFIGAVILGCVFRFTPNDWAKRFCEGATQMGAVCLLIGFSKLISTILADGQVINTIAHAALGLILSGTRYSKWMRYAVPYALILIGISAVCIFFLQSIGWS